MVDPEKFLKIFAGQFDDNARKGISLQSSFKQMSGWSSLQALIVTVAIHDEWGISFSDEDFRNAQTIDDLLEITQKKLGK
jgi:acyl carrier protein